MLTSIRLTPTLQGAKVNFPFELSIADRELDIPPATFVRVGLLYSRREHAKPTLSGDLQNADPDLWLRGKWSDVAPQIRFIKPTQAGFYQVLVVAEFAPYPGSPGVILYRQYKSTRVIAN